MSAPKVVITGCGFHDPVRGKFTRGDLWAVYEGARVVTWIFNALRGPDGEMFTDNKPFPDKFVLTSPDGNYFERKGILVLGPEATLNSEGWAYLEKWK